MLAAPGIGQDAADSQEVIITQDRRPKPPGFAARGLPVSAAPLVPRAVDADADEALIHQQGADHVLQPDLAVAGPHAAARPVSDDRVQAGTVDEAGRGSLDFFRLSGSGGPGSLAVVTPGARF